MIDDVGLNYKHSYLQSPQIESIVLAQVITRREEGAAPPVAWNLFAVNRSVKRSTRGAVCMVRSAGTSEHCCCGYCGC